MTVAEIMKLIDAGYTKTEIEAMEEPADDEHDNNDPGDDSVSVSDGDDNGGPDNNGNNNDSGDYARLAASIAELTKTVAAMQSTNAKKAESAPPHKMTAEDAIKGFFGVKPGE